jgi:hypothetical protein
MLLRMIGGAIVSWLINFLWMPKLIELLKSWHFGQTIREDGPKSHMKKQGTPVMGGLGFIASTLIAALIFVPKAFLDPKFLIIVCAFTGYGLIGFIDDYLVVVRHNNEGLRPRPKFLMQCALAAGLVIWYMAIEDTMIYTPFLSRAHGIVYPAVLFFIIAAQGREIADKQAQIIALQAQKDRYVHEIDRLESSIGPLRKLGVVQDTTMLSSFGVIQDWVSYLEYLENDRREK